VLIFSNTPPIWVKARIIDAKSFALTVVEEISMQLVDYNSGISGESVPYYYDAVWNTAEYADDSPTRYWLEIILEERQKGITVSEPRPFSVNGHPGNFRLTWLGYLGMGFREGETLSILTVGNGCICLLNVDCTKGVQFSVRKGWFM
jgi:hypothetical protein